MHTRILFLLPLIFCLQSFADVSQGTSTGEWIPAGPGTHINYSVIGIDGASAKEIWNGLVGSANPIETNICDAPNYRFVHSAVMGCTEDARVVPWLYHCGQLIENSEGTAEYENYYCDQ